LFVTLASAARALESNRQGLDVTGYNIANVNTPGYARRIAGASALAPGSAATTGAGDAVVVRAIRDRLLEDRLQREVSPEQRDAALASALGIVESGLGRPGESIDARLDDFFTAFAGLADDPTSASQRYEVVQQGQNLAVAFRDMADRFERARNNADRDIRAIVGDVGALTTRIAALNQGIASSREEASLDLRDQQSALVRQLAELVDISVLARPDGVVDIATGQGRALVVGGTAYAVGVTSVAPLGHAAVTINGITVTNEISGGRLGGYLRARDVAIPSYAAQLDDLAYEVHQRINALHTAGFDLAGVDAGDFFAFSTAPVGTSGAAKALIVHATVAADPNTVAAASVAQVGDNGVARAIASLRDDRVLDSNTATLSDWWAELIFQVGRDTKAAADSRDSRGAIVRQVEALRDEVSGVSLDEEAIQLLKFQRAYEANAKLFAVIDEMLEMVLNLTR
jgi:flagellar hook-associated protein 1 FlgK